MHYYGPFSDDLDGVLSLAQMIGYVEIKPDPDGFGYHVTPGTQNVAEDFDESVISPDLYPSIDTAIDVLGNLETAELELYATIHFIGQSNNGSTSEEALDTVQRLKPKFSKSKIRDAYQTLKQADLI